MVGKIAIFLLCLTFKFGQSNEDGRDIIKAVAKIGSPDGTIHGFATFSQEFSDEASTHIIIKLDGLPNGSFGVQIRNWGNLTRGCESFGDEFNPDNVQRHIGLRFPARKVGTIGNIVNNKFDEWNTKVSLFDRNSVIGRGIVVFEHADDNGMVASRDSMQDGSVGKPIACGIIGRYGAKII
uniref:Superoxide dismutase n=1 Tax=Rhabditophanes sp. KR3021 TaxID=114890 RepID=A0AC35UFZ8_9BILA